MCELAWKDLSVEECAERAAAVGLRSHRRHPRQFRRGGDGGPGRRFPDPEAWQRLGLARAAPTADRDRGIARLKAVDVPRIEPWAGCLWSSDEATEYLRAQVRTFASWGGHPLRFLEIADTVQLRQAKRGVGQAPPEDGEVDLEALFARFDELDYRGNLTIEYFDLPQFGWPTPIRSPPLPISPPSSTMLTRQ